MGFFLAHVSTSHFPPDREKLRASPLPALKDAGMLRILQKVGDDAGGIFDIDKIPALHAVGDVGTIALEQLHGAGIAY